MRQYSGDYHYQVDIEIVDKVIKRFNTIENMPNGCSIDFAVIEKDRRNETIFLEVNDGYALGNYGLFYLDYAKLLSSRWTQLVGVADPCDFLRVH